MASRGDSSRNRDHRTSSWLAGVCGCRAPEQLLLRLPDPGRLPIGPVRRIDEVGLQGRHRHGRPTNGLGGLHLCRMYVREQVGS